MIDSFKPSKVLIIGSGPIIIGQAAEFDYAGAQACKAMREEGIISVLVNSNPATIMTDEGIADIVYIEPLTVNTLARIIKRERLDARLYAAGEVTGGIHGSCRLGSCAVTECLVFGRISGHNAATDAAYEVIR